MLEQYLDDLRGELSRHLSEGDLQVRLMEIDAHLREGIEGRVELGLSLEEAERETLEAFGTVRSVARSITENPAKARLRPRLLWMAAAYALFFVVLMGGWEIYQFFPNFYPWFFGAILVFLGGFASAAFRARRPATRSILTMAGGFAFFCWLAYGLTWLNLYAFAGSGVVPPGQARASLAQSRQMLADRTADRAVFETGMNMLRGPFGMDGLRTEGGYLAPVIQPVSYNQRPQYTVLASAKEAQKAWVDLSQRGRNLFDVAQAQQQVDAIREAGAHPLSNLLSSLPSAAQFGTFQAGLLCLLDVTFAGLGLAAFAYRRRKRGGELVA